MRLECRASAACTCGVFITLMACCTATLCDSSFCITGPFVYGGAKLTLEREGGVMSAGELVVVVEGCCVVR